jgi:hypothetical protein
MACLMTANLSGHRPPSPKPNDLVNPFLETDVGGKAVMDAFVPFGFAVTNSDTHTVRAAEIDLETSLQD